MKKSVSKSKPKTMSKTNHFISDWIVKFKKMTHLNKSIFIVGCLTLFFGVIFLISILSTTDLSFNYDKWIAVIVIGAFFITDSIMFVTLRLFRDIKNRQRKKL